MVEPLLPSRNSLQFPWPRDDDVAGLAVRLAARDPVWIASIRQQVLQWRASRAMRLPIVKCDAGRQFSDSSIEVMEADEKHLLDTADWLKSLRPRRWPIVMLLCRTEGSPFDQRAAMATLLAEAGANCVLTTPRDAYRLLEVFDHCCRRLAALERDPLDELPLPCWGPAWQSPGRRIGLCS